MALLITHGFKLVFVVTVVSTCGRNEFQQNKRYEGYKSETCVGMFGCAKMCAQEGHCQSINYKPSHLECELVGGSADKDTTNFLGWGYASNLSFVNNKLGSCAKVSVPDSSVCIPLSSGNYTIVKKYCLPADIPTHAVLKSNIRMVGKTIKFICTSGYAGVGNSATTCLANGQWTPHSFQCIPDCGEPPHVSSATVQPGSTTIDSVRTYNCTGYTTAGQSVTCKGNGQWTAPTFVCEWPFGTYSLLQPLTGCPVGFESGSRTWHTDNYAMNMMLWPGLLKGYAQRSFVEWNFCTMTDSNASSTQYDWPPGDYCIMRYDGVCPSAFDEGSIYWDEEDDDESIRPMSGILPDGQYDSNAYMIFCCRNDGSTTNPITLPTSTPFVLFMYTLLECQSVVDMLSLTGFTLFDDEMSNNSDSSSGQVPVTDGPPNWIIHYCYYSL